jgi:hypothetical protein
MAETAIRKLREFCFNLLIHDKEKVKQSIYWSGEALRSPAG